MLQYGTGKLKITIKTYSDSLPYMVAVTILLFYKLRVKKVQKEGRKEKYLDKINYQAVLCNINHSNILVLSSTDILWPLREMHS